MARSPAAYSRIERQAVRKQMVDLAVIQPMVISAKSPRKPARFPETCQTHFIVLCDDALNFRTCRVPARMVAW